MLAKLIWPSWAIALLFIRSAEGQCLSGTAYFNVDENPTKNNKIFYRQPVVNIEECAAICYDHPFCLSAGFTTGDHDSKVCLLSFQKSHCENTVPTTSYHGSAEAVLITCIICDVLPPTTAVTVVPLYHGTPSILSSQSKYPPVAFTSQRASGNDCTYNRAIGLGVKRSSATFALNAIPNYVGRVAVYNDSVVGSAKINESACAELCYAHPYCDQIVYAESDGSDPHKPTEACLLLGDWSQLYRFNSSQARSSSGFRNISLMDHPECHQKHAPGCDFEYRRITNLGQIDLSTTNFAIAFEMDLCAGLCQMQLDCETPLFDYNTARCYFLTSHQLPLLDASNEDQAVDDSTPLLSATNYYVFSNITCEQGYLQYIPTNPGDKAKPGVKCDAGPNSPLHVINNVDPSDVLHEGPYFPDYVAVYRSSVTVEECQYLCVVDPRCTTIFFANDANAEQKLANAMNVTNGLVKCALYGYTGITPKQNAFDTVAPAYLSPNVSTEASESGIQTGITQYYNITKCATAKNDYKALCVATKQIRTSVLPTPADGVNIFYNVYGPTECDYICQRVHGCVAVAFYSLEDGSDACAIYREPINTAQDDNGPIIVREGIHCPLHATGEIIESAGQSSTEKPAAAVSHAPPSHPEPTGNLTLLRDQNNFPPIAYANAEAVKARCTYNRLTGVLPKGMTLISDPGVLTSNLGFAIGSTSDQINETFCARLCFDHPYCDQALYSETQDATGQNLTFRCLFFAGQVQLHYFNASAPDDQPHGLKSLAFLDSIACNNEKNTGCDFKFKRLTNFSSAIDLNKLDVVATPGHNLCASLCSLATTCDTSLFDANKGSCYFLTKAQASAIEASEQDKSTAPVDSDTYLFGPANYYLTSSIRCDPAFTHNVPKAAPGIKCAAGASASRIVNANAAQILSTTTDTGFYPNHTSILRTVESVDECQYACIAEPRCEIAFFAEDDTAAKSLATAANLTKEDYVKCLLYGYLNVEATADGALAIAPKINSANQTTSPSGITVIYDINGCDKVQDPEPLCKAATIRAENPPTVVEGELRQVYKVYGPSECDHLCGQLKGCKAVAFQSVQGGGDLCHIFNSYKALPAQSNDGAFIVRSELICPRI